MRAIRAMKITLKVRVGSTRWLRNGPIPALIGAKPWTGSSRSHSAMA